LADKMLKMFPNLEKDVKRAEIGLDGREYLSIVLFTAFFMFFFSFTMIFFVSLMATSVQTGLGLGLLVGMVLFAVTVLYLKNYPKLIVKKRIISIERSLLYALRHMYIQIKAGVSIYDSIVSVSLGNYGRISEEFKEIVKETNSGIPTDVALENSAAKNPSIFYSRTIWQISNGIKAGSDIAGILKNVIENISAQQRIMMRRYGAQLNPLTLVYMMVGIIMPSLGVTFLIILSSFSGIAISETMFWGILGMLTVFQFMFLGIIKSKRPTLV